MLGWRRKNLPGVPELNERPLNGGGNARSANYNSLLVALYRIAEGVNHTHVI